MTTKISYLEIDKFFNRPGGPSPRVPNTSEDERRSRQFFARLHGRRDDNHQLLFQASGTSAAPSPASSSMTLVDDDDLRYIFENTIGPDRPANEADIQADLQKCSIMHACAEDFSVEFQKRKQYSNVPPLDLWGISSSDLPIFRQLPPAGYSPFITAARTGSFPEKENCSPRPFNPHATPFIPSTPTRTAAPQPPPNANVNPHVPSEPWFAIFWAGASASDPRSQRNAAAELVRAREWSFVAIPELVQHFCWKGAEGTQNEFGIGSSERTASFARTVYFALSEECGQQIAKCFIQNLKACTVGTFRATWCTEFPTAIALGRQPSVAYVSSAICLASFIGDLFRQNLLRDASVHSCLQILLVELSSVEHIHSIHTLLLHAHTGLWRGLDGHVAVQEFVASFTQRAGALEADKSVLDKKFRKRDIERWVKEIVDMIRGWQL